ncbi:hypothetical protein [Aquabacterium sp.]|uniref:hypothetical protein n=1 Tax=Aquabacterium sp. TaxID=1872578 RepID=UPI0040384811
MFWLSACKTKSTKVNLDVVLFSYLDRPIFDVFLNQTDIGVAGPWPYSGRGTMTGVVVPIGLQKISWRLDGPKDMAGNGNAITAKNMPKLEVPLQNAGYLGVHIYSDDTVELIASPHFPEMSARGKEFDRQWRKQVPVQVR